MPNSWLCRRRLEEQEPSLYVRWTRVRQAFAVPKILPLQRRPEDRGRGQRHSHRIYKSTSCQFRTPPRGRMLTTGGWCEGTAHSQAELQIVACLGRAGCLRLLLWYISR